MEKVLGTRVIGMVPEDQNVRKAASAKTPVVLRYPASGSSIALKRIAAGLAGITYDPKAMQPKDSFVDRFTKVLFRGRK
jgi:septum site-determining protein MinD